MRCVLCYQDDSGVTSTDRFCSRCDDHLDRARQQGAADERRWITTELGLHIADLDARIAAGKGEWGTPGYVRDEMWSSWLHRREQLRNLVRIIEARGQQPSEEPKT